MHHLGTYWFNQRILSQKYLSDCFHFHPCVSATTGTLTSPFWLWETFLQRQKSLRVLRSDKNSKDQSAKEIFESGNSFTTVISVKSGPLVASPVAIASLKGICQHRGQIVFFAVEFWAEKSIIRIEETPNEWNLSAGPKVGDIPLETFETKNF